MALSSDEKRTRKRITAKGYLGATVSVNDSSNLDSERAELYIGTGGHVKVDLSGGSTVILKNVPSGTFLKGIYVDRVYRTGTTARDIVAIY